MADIIHLKTLVKLIDEPNQTICIKFIDKNIKRLTHAKGSAIKHQAWPGGYIDHISEVMHIAHLLYPVLNAKRKLPFSLSDALLTLFLHDLEKPWKHIETGTDFTKVEAKEFRKEKILEYGFELTDEHWNAIKYVEGENENYHPTKRMQGPLAAFIHCCDTLSARVWYDYPSLGEKYFSKRIWDSI